LQDLKLAGGAFHPFATLAQTLYMLIESADLTLVSSAAIVTEMPILRQPIDFGLKGVCGQSLQPGVLPLYPA
jgi:hypothetical protein